MTPRQFNKIIGSCFAIFLFVQISLGQIPNGALTGTITDSSGARVAGATIILRAIDLPIEHKTNSNSLGEFRFSSLPPARYKVVAQASGFAQSVSEIQVAVSSSPNLSLVLKPQAASETIQVEDRGLSLTTQPVETASSIQKTSVLAQDLAELPLAHRSFANIAYLSPTTQPVEPSDPTKARITAVSFAGSSGLNVDLSVDGGDNNDDYIGGFLQNYSPDAIQEFAVRTAQFDADTSRTNGGSVIITTRRGTNQWHGEAAGYFRERVFNARNVVDNPEPNPKQPFSRQNAVATAGGPIVKDKLWVFSSLEYVHENASIAYNTRSLGEFNALARLAAAGQIPSVSTIAVPTFTSVPYRDAIVSTRFDWAQSLRSQWFFRGAFDRYRTQNDLVQQATLPSTGATTTSHYYSFLVNQQFTFSPAWLGSFTFQASGFHHTKESNSHLGFALAFPFSVNFHTTSGFETFGDNQFVTPITAFPIQRDQQKYQYRYDVSQLGGTHSPKFGINFIHEPVLRGALFGGTDKLVLFPQDPGFYLSSGTSIQGFICDPTCPTPPIVKAGDPFSQSIKRLGLYAEDSWKIHSHLTLNYGLRYDTTFGLFRSNGADQKSNPAVALVNVPGSPIRAGIPHDYRKAFAPRIGIAYSPGTSGNTVVRAGVGLYYNDLAQVGWVDALRAVGKVLNPGDQAAVIDPRYHTPYALQASAGIEHAFNSNWKTNIFYEHQQGVHEYRRYEYATPETLPASLQNNISVFRTDNRSQYDGVAFVLQNYSRYVDFSAHYTLAKATTWGATVGELFDYVNGVSDVRNPFGPGDHGPSGEDVRHRFVLAGTLHLPYRFELATLAQIESARPFTMASSATDPATGDPVDLNNDGIFTNDRAIVNGVQTSLDQFRGVPFSQGDLRVSRDFVAGDRVSVRPFAEFFNLLNRTNPGNNFVGNIAALPFPVNDTRNATAFCLNPDCTATRPITRLRDLRVPAGALGDFFGPGTTVGIPFAAQLGVRVIF